MALNTITLPPNPTTFYRMSRDYLDGKKTQLQLYRNKLYMTSGDLYVISFLKSICVCDRSALYPRWQTSLENRHVWFTTFKILTKSFGKPVLRLCHPYCLYVFILCFFYMSSQIASTGKFFVIIRSLTNIYSI